MIKRSWIFYKVKYLTFKSFNIIDRVKIKFNKKWSKAIDIIYFIQNLLKLFNFLGV